VGLGNQVAHLHFGLVEDRGFSNEVAAWIVPNSFVFSGWEGK
jgi:hypothetical protein